MNMVTDFWLPAALASKVLLYMAVAFCIGGFFSFKLLVRQAANPVLGKNILQYIFMGAVLGMFATLAAFLVQVGSFANNGWVGMFNHNLASIILHSQTGYVQLGRMAAFGLFAALIGYALLRNTGRLASSLQWILVLASLFLAASFALSGHSSNISLLAQLLVSLHVLAISLWMGALFPLWQATRLIQNQPLQDSMHLFGRVAALIVGILLIWGTSVAVLLLKDVATLTGTAYGQFFMLKLTLVVSLLVLAALNKWLITPRLNHHLHSAVMAKRLRYMITLEMLLGLSVLIITATLTTVIGIE